MSPVVALHGFAGTGRMWDPLGLGLIAPDLPGHGDAGDARPVSFESCVEAVLRAAPERFTLAGYSMGGRIALHVALAAPERIDQLVLISTTAGIDDVEERRERREADERLASEVEAGTIEDFADRWTSLPLFAGTSVEAAALWRADILRNEPSGLAASLRGVGTGSMDPLWGRLSELRISATVIAGERDSRFCGLGARLASALPGAGSLVVVPGAGHGLPRESPSALAALMVA